MENSLTHSLEETKKKAQRTQREIPVLLANQAQNYFLSSWKKQGFNGESWKEVQRRTPGMKAYKYPKTKGLQRQTSPILVGAGYKKRGGTLRRSVSNMARTAFVSNQFNGFRIKMIIPEEYASYLNEGTPKMTKRQFVGQTTELTIMQTRLIERKYNEIWK